MPQDGGDAVAHGFTYVRGGAWARPGTPPPWRARARRRLDRTACASLVQSRCAKLACRRRRGVVATPGGLPTCETASHAQPHARRVQERRRRGAPPGEAAHDHGAHHAVRPQPRSLPASRASATASGRHMSRAHLGWGSAARRTAAPPALSPTRGDAQPVSAAQPGAWGVGSGTSQGGRGGRRVPSAPPPPRSPRQPRGGRHLGAGLPPLPLSWRHAPRGQSRRRCGGARHCTPPEPPS